MIRIAYFLFFLLPVSLGAQNNFPSEIINNGSALFNDVISKYKFYKVEIIYTSVEKRDGNIKLNTYHFGCDSNTYFYPASLVKLPCSIVALEQLYALKKDNEDLFLFTDSSEYCHRKCYIDSSNFTYKPSINHYIRKMMLVSDNHAYSRIYEWLSPDKINNRLWASGFNSARIIHRFDGNCKGNSHTTANPVTLFDKNNAVIYKRESLVSTISYFPPMGKQEVGLAHIGEKGKKYKTPKDFSNMNFLLLNDVHEMLIRLIYPEKFKSELQFKISDKQRQFLLQQMRLFPRASIIPKYDSVKFPDNFKKYLIYGNKKIINSDSIEISNIVGQSYGFMADCAYIEDRVNHISFFLSARIYVNADGIINDGKYEYKSIALPWFAELGMKTLEYERKKRNVINKNQ
jgi:hypothetical protein